MRPLAILLLLLATTCPAADDAGPLQRIAFGACHKLDRPFNIWDVMAAQKPQLFIFMGDTIYKDTLDMDEKNAEYAKLSAVIPYKNFIAKTPVIATWDDHDYGANDGGADYPKKEPAKQIFLNFFKEPKDSPRWKHDGIYHSYEYGPQSQRVQVILLDTRTFRGPLKNDPIRGGYAPDPDPRATMLGADQWLWLADQLKKPAQIRLIISSIVVLHSEYGGEKWANFPHDRKKLLTLLAASNGAILLSGDRHHGELSAIDLPGAYKLYDITSSGLNTAYPKQDEVNALRQGEIVWGENFGMITIDWSAKDPAITLAIHDEKGTARLKHTLKLSELARKPK